MEQQKLSEDQKKLIVAGLEAIAALEEAIKTADKLDEKRLSSNMHGLCTLIEKMMYCTEEEAKNNFDEIMKEMEDRADQLVGQIVQAQHKHGVRNG
jgi:polyhydroxyalkanoate synthesis regulator protein